MLLALLVLGVVGGAMLFSFYRPSTLTLASDKQTTDALALVKTALIGWTVQRGDPTNCIPYTSNGVSWVTCSGNQRPGEFPCPDRDNDGYDNDGNCSAGQLGRVPWKTLGIPEPKDSAGETLWYAVAGPFRTRGSNSNILNSDTRGNIIVYAADGTTALTTQAVVVIFAPGRAIGTQNRNPNTQAYCATTNNNQYQNRCAANYLETSAGRNNGDPAGTTGPFINGKPSSTFNDRVVYITAPEFMPSVEKRVASEVKAWLDGYRANSSCQCYPWAASFNINTGDAVSNKPFTNESVVGLNRGRFPFNNARPEDWNGPRPILSSWFTYNNWHTVIYYTLAKQNAQNQGSACTTCTGTTLTIDGKSVISAVFFTPGTPLGAIARPSNTLANYLEDATNNDNADDSYVTPTSTALDRDRIYTSVSSPAAVDTSQQCRQMGKRLRELAPCRSPPNLSPQCASLAGTDLNGVAVVPAQGLQLCSAACQAAALTLVNAPCYNTLRPSVCHSAHETLDHC